MTTNLQAGPAMARKLYQYDRFSGGRQEAGSSQWRQDEAAAQAAGRFGAEIDRTITLSDKGLSAFRGANWRKGKLGKFLDLVDAGVIASNSILVIERVSRLSRMPWMKQVELWKEILDRGITILCYEPQAEYTKANMNELGIGCPVVLYMMLAYMESKQKSDFSRTAWARKRQLATEGRTPHGGACPGWLRPVTVPHPKNPARAVTVAYELDEVRAAAVRQVFLWSAERGWGAWRIARELQEAGTPPLWGCKRWTVIGVRGLLAGRQVLGEYQPTVRTEHTVKGKDGREEAVLKVELAGDPIAGYYPAVIDEPLWARAQQARRARKHKGGRHGKGGEESNLFTRLAWEATSRRQMHMTGTAKRGVYHRYLHTQPRTDGVPYARFEEAVLDVVARLVPADVDGRHEADELTARVDRLQQEHRYLENDRDDLMTQLLALPPQRRPRGIVARVAELDDQIAAKKAELDEAKLAADTSGRTETLTDCQTCIGLLEKVKGTPREAHIREQIKQRLLLLVESVWVRVQRTCHASRYLHVLVCLHGGEARYTRVECPSRSGRMPAPPWDLEDELRTAADVRRGAGVPVSAKVVA